MGEFSGQFCTRQARRHHQQPLAADLFVGTPGQPVLRVNPISAMAPGVLRKIFEFNTGKQNNPIEFPPNN